MKARTSRSEAGAEGKTRPRLLVVSSVLPFPGQAGQNQRVRLKLAGFRDRFHVTFLTAAPTPRHGEVRRRLRELCDEVILVESRWRRGPFRALLDPVLARGYALATGLKVSNFVVDRVELTPGRVLRALGGRSFDLAVFEYWHATRAVHALRSRGIACVLDMHDLLWQSRRRQLAAHRALPAWLREIDVARYRRREEAAWADYDALVTINAEEDAYVARRLPEMRRFYAPMGVDMETWSFGPDPARPPRLAYYGGLGSRHNRHDARLCVEKILPQIRRQRLDVELWIVGSRPPADLLASAEDEEKLKVTGFVDDVQSLLRTMTAVLCPWTGTYGFRSRLVEVMALGVPVVASPDAVHGMDLEHGKGIFLASTPEQMAARALELLAGPEEQQEQARAARRAVEERYSFDATYGRLTRELEEWIDERGQ